MKTSTCINRNIEITRRYINGEIGQAIADDYKLSQPRIGVIVTSTITHAINYCTFHMAEGINIEVRNCSPLRLRRYKEDVLKYLGVFEKYIASLK